MKNFSSMRFTGGAAAILVMASACTSSGTSLTPSSGSDVVRSRQVRASWMAPQAKRRTLLYGAAFDSNGVYVYAYPKGTLVGTLTGFNGPQGECVDQSGNVFIANTGASQIIEYAHGAKNPTATLDDPNEYPVSCSVNPKNGDLAVTNILSGSGGPGSVSVFKKASGAPKTLSDANIHRMDFLGYDDKGNLFVDGTDSSGGFRYAKLPSGRKKFVDITLDKAIQFPGDVQYDGKYIAIGDQGTANVYQTSGGTVVGTTTLGGAQQVGTFFIFGTTILCPSSCAGDVSAYAYPGGGEPKKSFQLAGGAPGVVVISK
jgi:hypothetical protein